jgi:hypothetical protein
MGELSPLKATPNVPPTQILDDIQLIKASITVLEKVIQTGNQPTKPAPPPKTNSSPQQPKTRAKGKQDPPSFANVAAVPPHPSVVVSLDHLSWDPRLLTLEVCNGITSALCESNNDQVRISATWWTVKGNLILTGGPNMVVQQLQPITLPICQHIATAYRPADSPSPSSLPSIRPNMKWSNFSSTASPQESPPLAMHKPQRSAMPHSLLTTPPMPHSPSHRNPVG